MCQTPGWMLRIKEGSGPCPRGLPDQPAGRCTDQHLQQGKAVATTEPRARGREAPEGPLADGTVPVLSLVLVATLSEPPGRHTHPSSPLPPFPLLPSAFALSSGQLAPPLTGQRDWETTGDGCVRGTSGNHVSAHGSWSPWSHLSLSSRRRSRLLPCPKPTGRVDLTFSASRQDC